ncbi:MAG: hypothetical protein R3D29_03530 [Nitratireductor sp.]
MQPASFIMKAPALLYVFIFISIRALRFNPKFVILAGIVAAMGWAAIIIYVTHIDPGDNMLTRSYVQYLTSNSILIGAEVDKILSILIVTAVLALAVNRSRNMLVTSVSERAAASACRASSTIRWQAASARMPFHLKPVAAKSAKLPS